MDITQLLVLLVGFVAGFIGALTGLGGGVFIVPSLSLFLGIPIHSAIAVSIFVVVATGMAGAARYVKQGLTDIKLALYLETMTVVGVVIGVHLALLASPEFLYFVFSALLYYLAFMNLFTTGKEERRITREGLEGTETGFLGLSGSYYDRAMDKEVRYKVRGEAKGALISFLAGIGSGLLGIGGGVFKVAAMNLFMEVPLKVSVGTSNFMISITAATGALLYMISGVAPISYIAFAVMGTMLGATTGSRVMNRIRSKHLKYLLFLLMLYLGVNMMLKGLSVLMG